ncbi:MAG TPA: hypothetical protein ENL06_01545 [Candidatus Portnoybacteria bacterium]|nr:hypothetical protein [Candidatus Portnoybacteria bacterium]
MLEKSKSWYIKFISFVLAIITAWLLLIVAETAWSKYKLVREIQLTQNQLKYLDNNNQKLKETINFLQNKNFLQKEVKEKLNLKDSNEKMIIFK